ncbi:LLM class F420-dependent oxidoreductase [Actinosynnema sp. ALI-1.44]|uniref:TIGR03619 family F420-dependent LLM class oxidoreductase n=1 Tax=Actinosynnema sp. ALI-1.44 TaxID=1933779 RepID=UPI00097C9608|nr:TIGR03619 family F420-dependent LLM class oxidoreductase [Actinosynnema sp. ALI-1.44]ONI88641.1 LLM class F420-dependent oxidoreductase [Actinosynnema sp. ALI-1.44]
MRIGFCLPQIGAVAEQATELARFSREAEALGAASLWVGDRLLSPVDPQIGYPPGVGTTLPEQFHRILDPFAALTVAATATEHVRLGTHVLNAPWYPPAILARSLTTIDLVSRGRLIAGLGAGWMPEEFEAVGVKMAERGRRLDESLLALEQLWTKDVAEFHGEYWTVPATNAALKPAQRPRPPVYIGGWAPAALRRVAEHGDGWLPATRPTGDVDPAVFTGPFTEIQRIAEQQGRDPAEVDMILRVNSEPGTTVDDFVAAIRQIREKTEIQHVVVDTLFIAKDVDHVLEMVGSVLERA